MFYSKCITSQKKIGKQNGDDLYSLEEDSLWKLLVEGNWNLSEMSIIPWVLLFIFYICKRNEDLKEESSSCENY